MAAAAAAAALRRSPHRHLLLLPRPRLFSAQSNPKPGPNPNPNPKPNPLSILYKAIKSESDPDRIAALFQSSTRIRHFYSRRCLYEITVQKLSALHRTDLIERILESQRSDPRAPKSEGFYARLLHLYSVSRMPDAALQLFDKIPQRTQLSFCALLTALLNNKKYDLFFEKFNQLPNALGIELGIVPYSLYLKALCAVGEVAAARKVLDEMPETKGLVPDIVCYNAVLDGYLKEGNEEGFNEILDIIFDRRLEPSLYTYNRRMLMLCGNSQSAMAEELLDLIVLKELQPNLKSFNVLIDGFCKEGDVDSAVEVFQRMQAMSRKSRMNGAEMMKRESEKDRVLPNGATYVVLVTSLVEKGEFGLALKFCKECMARKFAPPFEIVKRLVEGLAKSSKFEDAKDIAEKMNSVVVGDAVCGWKKVQHSLALDGRTGD